MFRSSPDQHVIQNTSKELTESGIYNTFFTFIKLISSELTLIQRCHNVAARNITSSPIGKALLDMSVVWAELEHELIHSVHRVAHSADKRVDTWSIAPCPALEAALQSRSLDVLFLSC